MNQLPIHPDITFEAIKEAVRQLPSNSEVKLCGKKIILSQWLKTTHTLIVNSNEAYIWYDICDKGSVKIFQIPDGPSEPEPILPIQFYNH